MGAVSVFIAPARTRIEDATAATGRSAIDRSSSPHSRSLNRPPLGCNNYGARTRVSVTRCQRCSQESRGETFAKSVIPQ